MDYTEFKRIPLGDVGSLRQHLGSPSDQETIEIEGRKFSNLEYRDPRSGEPRALFLVDPQSNMVVEKTYFILSGEKDELEYWKKTELAEGAIQQLLPKCSHHGEIIYFNPRSGKFVLSGFKGKRVVAVVNSTPELTTLRIQENQNRKCR